MDTNIAKLFNQEVVSLRRTSKRFKATLESDTKKSKRNHKKTLKSFKDGKIFTDNLKEFILNENPSFKDFQEYLPENDSLDFSKFSEDELKNGELFKELNLIGELGKSLMDLEHLVSDHSFINRNTLINLVMLVERAFGSCLSKFFNLHPVQLGEEKKVSLKDLSGFKDVEQVYNLVIENEVESIVRKSVDDWMKEVKKFGIVIDYFYENRNEIIEVFQARNVIIHNGAKVNKIYLSRCNNESTYKLNEDLDISDEYIRNAIETMTIFTFSFVLEFSKKCKLLKANENNLDTFINDIAFVLLNSEDYKVAEWLYSYFDKLDIDENTKLICRVNYYICQKSVNGLDGLDELRDIDFSAKKKIFRMAKTLLLENYDESLNMIKELFEEKEIRLDEVERWPLFKWFRDSEYYGIFKKEVYPNIRSKDLVREPTGVETETDSTQSTEDTFIESIEV